MTTHAAIIFLGTAGDQYVVARQLRSSGGIVLQVGENQFHIDPGPGALVQAKLFNVSPRANTAVLVSHAHLNHCNDANAIIDAMTYRGFDKKGVLIANETYTLGNEYQQKQLLDFCKNFLERIIIVEPGKRIGINEVEIQALPAYNEDPKAVGYKFFTQDFTLTYSGDTEFRKELLEHYEKSNVLILNVQSPEKTSGLSLGDAIKIVDHVKPRLCILTHFGTKMLETDPLFAAREVQKATDVQTIAAKDGMVLNPVSYAVSYGQRTLQAFKDAKSSSEITVKEIPLEPQFNVDRPDEENRTLKEVVGSEKQDDSVPNQTPQG